jgi:Trypsin-co-occurring domain 1
MQKVLDIAPADGKEPILIQVTEVEGEGGTVVQAGGKISFEDMLQKIKPFCESIITNIKELSVKPDSASAEFGIKVSAKGNLFIVEASGEATLKITLNWSLK